MARIREFDPQQALEQAMELFWRKGYADTSIRELVTHTGVAHAGLYGQFGGKEALFSAALQRYNDTVLSRLIQVLEAPGAGMAELQRFFERWATEARKGTFYEGCFLCNSAIEFGDQEGMVRQQVSRALERISSAFEGALLCARASGDLRGDLDPAEAAGFLLATLLGAAVLLRAKVKPAPVIRGVRLALRLFD
jgi:TetR/AcrR family transcriptional repressor of nem operon